MEGPDGMTYFLTCECGTAEQVGKARGRCEGCGKEYHLKPLVEHGRTCPKRGHVGDGYLHSEHSDRPYDVDGVMYCGRCHEAL